MIYHQKPPKQYNEKKELGRIHVYTGQGKGKTTAALGLIMRALGHGHNALVIQFMKGDKDIGELKMAQKMAQHLDNDFELLQFARPEPVDFENPQAMDTYLANEGLDYVRRAMQERRPDLLVLDEINPVMYYNLLPVQDVLDFLDNKHQETEVVLTGRDAPPEILERADLVTVMDNLKHYYHRRFPARAGIEF